MPRLEKDLVITVLVVETALLAMFFGLKIDHDTIERELKVANQYESAEPDSVDYGILRHSSRAQPVRSEVSHPLFDFAVERFIN
ncbi:MAG: hypothetical protein KC777_22275 [Cyanobacteria bacterium HKST-UBA02]|nr:hypothetical protein [Cyanobacteria bacterium HKST-UBA02]